MIEFFVLSTLWFCVSMLCIECVNREYNNTEEWAENILIVKIGVLIVMPILYLALTSWKAFEK